MPNRKVELVKDLGCFIVQPHLPSDSKGSCLHLADVNDSLQLAQGMSSSSNAASTMHWQSFENINNSLHSNSRQEQFLTMPYTCTSHSWKLSMIPSSLTPPQLCQQPILQLLFLGSCEVIHVYKLHFVDKIMAFLAVTSSLSFSVIVLACKSVMSAQGNQEPATCINITEYLPKA